MCCLVFVFFFNAKAFLLTSLHARMATSFFCWVLQATSPLWRKRGPGTSRRPNPQVGSRPSCRELWSVQSRAVWCKVVAAAAQNRTTAMQHTKWGSLCSKLLPFSLLFSSTAIPFGTGQVLVVDHSKTYAIAWPRISYSIFWTLFTPFATGSGDLSLQALIFWGAKQ